MEREILEQVSKEFNLPKKKVKMIYDDWLGFIKDTIENMDFTTDKELLGFTIPSIGKLVVNRKKIPYINKNKYGRGKFQEDTGDEKCNNHHGKQDIQ